MAFGLFKINRDKVIKMAADGDDFEGKDLSGLDLSQIQFKQTSFQGAKLVHTRFTGSTLWACDFEEANLQGADLSNGSFEKCGFCDATMSGVRLDGSTFKNCDFENASIPDATFAGAAFSGCDLEGTELDGAVHDTGDEEDAAKELLEMQAFIGACEAQGLDLGGLSVGDPVGFWARHIAITEAPAQGGTSEAAAVEQGFRDMDHWNTVSRYFYAKYSHQVPDEDGVPEIQITAEFTNAMMAARQGQVAQAQTAAASANPELLAPVDGISIEAWGAASAALAQLPQGAPPEQGDQVLAQLGLDRARYDQANMGWQAKMQGDTTGAISTKFGEAFAAQQGMTSVSGEPCTFERFCEVMAAQSAWAEQGFDVNAQLRTVFGIDAAAYSSYASYWSPKMSTDIELITRQVELMETYAQKYAGVTNFDDDLDL